MVIGWSSSKFLFLVLIGKARWQPLQDSFIMKHCREIVLKKFFSETTGGI